MQSSKQNKFFIHLIHFPYQNLKQFPWFPFIQFFPNIRRWNHTVSSYRLKHKVNSTPKFHTAEWHLTVHGCRNVSHHCSMTQRLQSVSSQHLTSLSSITIAATSVLLLLVTLLLTLLGMYISWMSFSSHHADVVAQHLRLGLYMTDNNALLPTWN